MTHRIDRLIAAVNDRPHFASAVGRDTLCVVQRITSIRKDRFEGVGLVIRIGIVGVGFMGFTHFEGARDLEGGEVTAICTRNAQKLAGDWTSIQGNFGPRGGHVDTSSLSQYTDYRQLIADPNIDLVDVCLPTDQHFDVVMECLRAGKPVLVEKPISVSLEEGRKMLAASEETGTPLFVAHVLPFFPNFDLRPSRFRTSDTESCWPLTSVASSRNPNGPVICRISENSGDGESICIFTITTLLPMPAESPPEFIHVDCCRMVL